MANPVASDVHVNKPLTNISVAYMQKAEKYIAGTVFPIIPVQKQSDRYFKYNKGDWFRTEADLRAPGSESKGVGYTIDNTPTYYADVYAVHKDVDDQTKANADSPINMDKDATMFVTNQLLLKREKIWTSTYFTTGIWDTDKTGVSGTPNSSQIKQWDASGSTPIQDIQNNAITMAKSTGYMPNVLVIGAEVLNSLRNHADILDRIKYTQRGIVSTDLLASLFGVDKVVVAMSIENTAEEQASDAMSFVFGKNALLMYSNPNPGLNQPSAGYHFAWTGFSGAGGAGVRIKRFRMEATESDRIEGQMAFDSKLISSDLGIFFSGCVG